MFNTSTYNAGDANLRINSCSGGIYKTYKESWFKRFHLESLLAETLFRKENCFYNKRTNEYSTDIWKLKDKYYDDKDNIKQVIIIQMIICGNMEVIAEIIYKNNFEKYFETVKGEKAQMEPNKDYGSEEFWKEQERIAEEERLINKLSADEED